MPYVQEVLVVEVVSVMKKYYLCVAEMVTLEKTQEHEWGLLYLSIDSGRKCRLWSDQHWVYKPSVDECKYIPLPPSLRTEVQEKFATGITVLSTVYYTDVRSQLGGRAARQQY